VRASGVSRSYANGLQALDRVDLRLAEAELVSLLGPSGCGKSTLLRILAGLLEPTAGAVEGAFAGAGQVGVCFQEPTLLPWATVFENVWLPLRLSGLPRATAEPRVAAAIDRVGLGGFAGSYPRALSGGMKMRVAIARALVTEPRLLLLDEPFAALDEITRFQLNEDLLRAFAERRLGVLFVTHSVFESVFLSTRIVVLSRRPGRVVGELAVDLPWPRTPELRTSPRYAELCRQASALLAQAMAA
jgi:NitT/TauT family transport system ATP-binding protein